MDADFTAIAGMLFSLIVVVVIGGGILLYPLSRRLGELLEQRLAESRDKPPEPRELTEMRRDVEFLQGEVARLSEQQEFTDSLLRGKGKSLHP